MLISILKYLKCLLLGCEKSSPGLEYLEKDIKEKEKKLEEIENEKNSDSDIVDYFNNK